MKLFIKEGCLLNIQVLHWMNEKLAGLYIACKPSIQRTRYSAQGLNIAHSINDKKTKTKKQTINCT